jgi:hypothetical protein
MDSILPQPESRAPMEYVQGGGGPGSVVSVATANRAANASPRAKGHLKTLTNGLTVRYVTEDIKDDIMNLRFEGGEQILFDKHLKFNTPFIRRYIGIESTKDNTVLEGKSIDDVESWVTAKVAELNLTIGDETKTTVREALTPDELIGTTPLRRMTSSGTDNDCLVHSILTSVSQTFRKLDKGPKDAIAGLFRRTVLVKIYDALIKNNPKDDLKRIREDLLSTGNLDLDVATQFAKKYNINILLRDRARDDTPIPWTIINDNSGSKIIIIYNPGKNHFEAVSDLNGKYIFEYSFIKDWASKMVYRDEENLACKFKTNDIVEKGGEFFNVLLTAVNDGVCKHVYIVNINNNTPELLKDVNDGIVIQEAEEEKKEDAEKRKTLKGDPLEAYTKLYDGKQAKAKELIDARKKHINEIPVINIADTLGEYTIVPDAASPSSPASPAAASPAAASPAAASPAAASPSSPASPALANLAPKPEQSQKPKTSQEKFYDFWKIYINEDGTDGFHRMTGRSANAMQEYLEEIRKAHEDYLLKGALRYLQRKENPVLFNELYKEPEDTFGWFFEPIPVPSDVKTIEVKEVKEVKPSDKFTKMIQDIKIKESIVKGHFINIETLYTAFIHLITGSRDRNEIINKQQPISKELKGIVNTLIEVETTIGNSKRAIIEMERKLIDKPDEIVSKELESTKKFIEESNTYINSMRRYKNAAVLAGKVITGFLEIHQGSKGATKKDAVFKDLTQEYDYAVRLISDPTLKPRKAPVQEEEDEEDEEDEDYEEEEEEEEDEEDKNETASQAGSGTVGLAGADAASADGSLPTVKPLPTVKLARQKADQAAAIGRAVLAAGQVQTRSGRVVKKAQPGGRGPRQTRKRRSI